jgi:hypothetical protein
MYVVYLPELDIVGLRNIYSNKYEFSSKDLKKIKCYFKKFKAFGLVTICHIDS